MTKCMACNKDTHLDELLKCVACKDGYHFKCYSMPPAYYKDNLPRLKKTWKCDACMRITHRKGDNTPIRGGFLQSPGDELDTFGETSVAVNLGPVKMLDLRDTLSQSSTSTVPNFETMSSTTDSAALLAELRQLRQELTEVKLQNSEIKTQMSSISEHLTKTLNEQSKVLQNAQLEIDSLKSTIGILQQRMAMKEQDSLKNDLEIAGLIEEDNEDLHQIVKTISQKVGVELRESDIDDVIRVGPRVSSTKNSSDLKVPRPVVVKLVRKRKRDELIKAARSRRNVTSENVLDGRPSRLFFNERLTRDNRILFREARSRCSEHGFRYCWIRNEGIFIRRSDGRPATRISTTTDLDEKVGPPKQQAKPTTDA